MVEVGGTSGSLLTARMPFSGPLAARSSGVDFFLGGGAFGGEGQVHQRDVDGRHAQGEPSTLPLTSCGSTRPTALRRRSGRDDVGGSGAARRRSCDGRPRSPGRWCRRGWWSSGRLDADAVGQDLGDRGQAVGGAGGVGDDGHVGTQRFFIDAHDDGGVDVVTARGGDQHALGALVEQRLGLGLGGVGAGAFRAARRRRGRPS